MAGRASLAALACGSLALAALSLLAPSTPGYDAWAWLVWGREVAGLELNTEAGPAWKPLPVLVTTALAPFGEAAPWLWLLLARAGGLLAVALAFRLAFRLAAGRAPWVAGAAAAIGLLAVVGFARGVWLGSSEGLLLATCLLAFERHLDGRRGQAFALGLAAGLLRPEVWPFLGAYGVVVWRAAPRLRPLVAASPVLLAAAWFLPELWGSGDLLRSSERARIPNPGQPALAEHPALEVLRRFALMVPAPLLAGAMVAVWAARRGAASRDPVVALAAGGAAWLGLVAAMSEAGYAGEERYLLPAAACACVLGGVGLARLAALLPRRVAAVAGAAALAAALALGLPRAAEVGRSLGWDARLAHDLGTAVDRAGGPDRLRACGTPVAGRYRFPLLAWRLGVPIAEVTLDPRRAGVVYRSRLTHDAPPEPPAPAGLPRLGAAGEWEVLGACGEPAA